MDVRRASSAVARFPGLIAVPVLWLSLRLAYGIGYVHYDALYALIWGRDLIHGHLPPDFADRHSPTEHPLANVIAAPLSLLHFSALRVMNLLVLLFFALLGWLAFRLGRAVLNIPAGVLFAALLLTCPPLVQQAMMGSIDILFLVLIMWATVLEAECPRRGGPVFVVLFLCGLLRPEAWLLGAAYWLYLWRAPPGLELRTRLRYGAAVVAAPVLWILFDWASSGDPVISLTGTRRAALQTGSPHSLGAAITHGPHTLASILGTGISVLGIAGAITALILIRRRAALPLTLLALGLLGFLALGAVGLPVIPRYAFVPSLMVALFCAYAVFGWLELEPGRARQAWMIGAPLLLIALIATNIRYYTKRLPVISRNSAALGYDDAKLNALLSEPSVRSLTATCRPISVRFYRDKPEIAYLIGGHARDYILLNPSKLPGPGLYLDHFALPNVIEGIGPHVEPPLPPTWRLVASVPHWRLYANCTGA